MKSLYGRLKQLVLLAPATWSADSTSSAVDMQSFGSAILNLIVGAFTFTGSNKITVSVEESDDGTTFTKVADADLQFVESAGVHKVLDGTEDQNLIHPFYYRGVKRYVHLALVEGGTVSVALGVYAVQGDSEMKPPL